MRKAQVVLVDDQAEVGALSEWLSASKEIEVVAKLGRIAELQSVVQRLQPDVVVLKNVEKSICCQEVTQMLNSNERVRVIVGAPTDEATDWGPSNDRIKVIVPSAEPQIAKLVSGMATHGLSERESLVLRLIARGYTNKEIATQLDVSVKTIEKYKTRSLDKLGIRSRVEVVKYAISQGWMID